MKKRAKNNPPSFPPRETSVKRESSIIDNSRCARVILKHWVPALRASLAAGMTGMAPFLLLASCILFLSSCGTLAGSGSSDTKGGPQVLTFDSVEGTFNITDVPKESYQTFPIRNKSGKTLTLQQLGFSNNVCNAFSFYNITDKTNAVLLTATSPLKLTLLADDTINVTIRFNPQVCSHSDYTTLFQLTFTDDLSQLVASTISLRSAGKVQDGGGGTGPSECPALPKADDFDELFLYGIPEAGTYYLRIDAMRAFILPIAKGAEQYATVIGTDVGGTDLVPFVSPFVALTMDAGTSAESSFTIQKITACDSFIIPSAKSDENFKGASTALTSADAVKGTIKRTIVTLEDKSQERQTNFLVPELKVKLRSEIKEGSNIKDGNTNIFQTNLILKDLTTTRTEIDKAALAQLNVSSQKPGKFFPFDLDDSCADKDICAIRGLSLSAGSLTLVGKGIFENSDNSFIGSKPAKTSLLEPPAVIFVQLEASIMKKVGGGE